MVYKCYNCDQLKDSKAELREHINVDHLNCYLPYKCIFCLLNIEPLVFEKSTRAAIKLHVQEMHPAEKFAYVCSPDEEKYAKSREMLRRSLSQQTEIDVITISDSDSNSDSPSLSRPQSVSSDPSKEGSGTPASLEPIIVEDDEDDDFQPNAVPVETQSNITCALCQVDIEAVDLGSQRDHVKMHFGEQFGYEPIDLENLSDAASKDFTDLMSKCFPDAVVSPPPSLTPENRKSPSPALSSTRTASFDCGECGRAFKYKRWLWEHQDQSHTLESGAARERRFQERFIEKAGRLPCTICKTTHSSIHNFETHKLTIKHKQNLARALHPDSFPCPIKTKVNPIGGRYPCDICETSYGSIRDLETHKRTDKHKRNLERASIPTSFTCNKCGKLFMTWNSFRIHSKRWCLTELNAARKDENTGLARIENQEQS